MAIATSTMPLQATRQFSDACLPHLAASECCSCGAQLLLYMWVPQTLLGSQPNCRLLNTCNFAATAT